MERITLKPRWVYDIEFSGMEDCSRILITDFDEETITGLAANGEFVTLTRDSIEDIGLSKLDRAEAQIWRAITVLAEDHQAAQRRLDEETRYMGRLESAITTLLEGLTD